MIAESPHADSPHAFVINLASAKDRWAAVASQLRRQGVPFTRIEGVVGKHHRANAHVSPWCKVMCTDGVIGCALSHIKAWKAALRSGAPATLVMEDDVVLTKGFVPKLNERMAELDALVGRGAWDVLLAGCFGLCDQHQHYTNPVMTGLAPALRMITGNVACVHSPKVFAPEFFWGLHCYVITRRGARNLLKHLRKVWYHVDFQVNTLPLRVYACHPNLATQNGFDASFISPASAPVALTAALSRFRDAERVPFDYYMAVPITRHVNGWVLVFAAAGVVAALFPRRRAWALAALAAVLLPDLALVATKPSHAMPTGLLVATFIAAAAVTTKLKNTKLKS